MLLALLLAPILYADPTTLPLSSDAEASLVETEPQLNLIAIEGGKWSEELHQAVAPDCQHNITTQPYDGKVRTGFVSFPRSGNSYMRSLIERATGFQTSSICGHPFFILDGDQS